VGETLKYLEQLVWEQGYDTECIESDGHELPSDAAAIIAMETIFVPSKQCKDWDEVLPLMDSLARTCGYRLEQLKFTPIEPGKNPDKVPELLVREAATKGYSIDVRLFAAALYARKCSPEIQNAFHQVLRQSNDILNDKCFILSLPHAKLNLEAFDPHMKVKWSEWTISGTGKRGYVNAKSDYGDNSVWPSMCMQTNVTMLLTGNLSSVVTPLILKLPGTSVVTPRGSKPGGDREAMNVRSMEELNECAIDVIKRRRKGETEGALDFPCKKALLRSFREPRFGDVQCETLIRVLEKPEFFAKLGYGTLTKQDITKLVLSRLETAHENLTGINWRLTNPGTQWTSSINPIMENPRDWYGEHYVSFRLGCEPVETCLRLMRLRDGIWKNLPRDIFGFIVRIVVWENSLIYESTQ